MDVTTQETTTGVKKMVRKSASHSHLLVEQKSQRQSDRPHDRVQPNGVDGGGPQGAEELRVPQKHRYMVV